MPQSKTMQQMPTQRARTQRTHLFSPSARSKNLQQPSLRRISHRLRQQQPAAQALRHRAHQPAQDRHRRAQPAQDQHHQRVPRHLEAQDTPPLLLIRRPVRAIRNYPRALICQSSRFRPARWLATEWPSLPRARRRLFIVSGTSEASLMRYRT